MWNPVPPACLLRWKWRRGKLSDDEKRQYSKTNVHYKNKLWQLYIRAVTLPENQRKEIESILSHVLKLIKNNLT